MTKQLMAAVAMMLIAGSASVTAQTASPHKKTTKTHKKAAAPKAHVESATEREIRELREEMRGQQAQIDSLKQLNADKDAKLASAAADAATANSAAAAATAQAQTVSASVQANTDAITAVNSTVSDLKAANTGLAQTISDTKKDLTAAIESPSTIHYKGVTITPAGFLAAETVYRTRSMQSDINTPFNAVPYMNAAQAYLSEFNASGRQSRLAVLVDGKTSWGHMGGYYEMDFLSAGVTSNANQTNSYTMRQREAWAKAETSKGFSFTGGQMWSLVTEVRKGINEVPAGEALPNTIDPQYHVGFSFTRQLALRAAQQVGKNAAVAISIEGPQTVLAATTNAPYSFVYGALGATGGLLNDTGGNTTAAGVASPGNQNYSDNVAPDVVFKATFDPPKFGHYEFGGIARFFRDRYFPTYGFNTAIPTAPPPANTGVNNTTLGGGVFANVRFPVTHFLDLGAHVMQGAGTGRYGTSNLGDVTVRPNGTFEPLRNSQGLLTIETHPTKKLDVYGYAGGEYLQRTFYKTTLTAGNVATTYYTGYAPLISKVVTTTAASGTSSTTSYGQIDTGCSTEPAPANASGISNNTSVGCSGNTRAVLEGTAGFTYRIYSNPRFGRIQYQAVYSYLTRSGWTGQNTNETSGFGSPKATNNMAWTSFRYYIP